MSILNRTIKPELTNGLNAVTLANYGEMPTRLTPQGEILKGCLFLKWTDGHAESVHRIYFDETNQSDLDILDNYVKAIQEQANLTGKDIAETLETLKKEQTNINVIISERASQDGSTLYKNYQYNEKVIKALTQE